MRLEKILRDEKKKEVRIPEPKKMTKKMRIQEQKAEAKRRLDIEVRHQTEEAETRAPARKMMSDAASNKPSFNTSCTNLLNNYQGN